MTQRLQMVSALPAMLAMLLCASLMRGAGTAIFNVKDYGATGAKTDDAGRAIQKAIDACAAAGGGMVYIPPGQYTSGTLHLRSHVNLHLEAGATLLASEDPSAFAGQSVDSKAALLYGEDVEDVAIEGHGTVDGQAEYIWRPDDFERGYSHKIMMESMGKSLMRSFPKGFPKRTLYPHLVWLGRAKDVRITGLTFLRSPSWTMALYACQRMVIDGVYIYTSLKDAVWCDGIDIDGCRDIHIANSTIETGDDCIIFISAESWGPALPCENITVTNCKLSSASAAIKFSEGNKAGIHHIVVDNCVITDCNRGITFHTILGGGISDVILSNLTMSLHRFDWFWAGDGNPFSFGTGRVSEWNKEAPKPDEPKPGLIENVMIRNIIAHVQGSSIISGHPETWLENISFDNVKLFLSTDPAAPYDTAVHALEFHYARNLKVKGVEVTWEKPALDKWQSALYFEKVEGLEVDDFRGRQAWPGRGIPAVALDDVTDAVVRNSRAARDTDLFLKVTGSSSRSIGLLGNDFRQAKVPYELGSGVSPGEVKALNNLLPAASAPTSPIAGD
jgi:hypothetical protein